MLKSIMSNKLFRLWMKWEILKSLAVAFTFKPFDFKLIEYGFQRSWLVNILVVCIPIKLALASFSKKLLVLGKINWYVYLGSWATCFFIMFCGIIFYDLKSNFNYERTYVLKIINTMC